MSELRDKFKALKEQRGSSAPTPAQLRMLKQQKQLQKAGGGPSQPAPAKPPSAPVSQPAAPSGSKAPSNLPDDFFQAPAPKKQAVAAPGSSVPQPRPVTTSAPSAGACLGSVLGGSAGTGAPTNTSLPEGFFTNKEADAKARGVKLPDAKDKEAEFQEFQRMLEEQVKAAEVAEAQEAETEAADKEQREDFIQWVRMQRLEEIKRRKAGAKSASEDPDTDAGAGAGPGAAPAAAAAAAPAADGDDGSAGAGPGSIAELTAELLGMPSAPDGLGPLQVQSRKKRVIDTLNELLPGSDDSEGSEEEGDGPLLDWRSKGV
uniref:ZNF380 coiled-coil domain-containing protein n=1 Tax=Chlamydomonas leiostraca TaxID=1034604 RepID=A0A7S0WYL4_9CHLO|mmetsp:Transcript_35404/g.89623  ORF Transcript_35404/g.89623 Transcript_35404/m.89623 type:complete len:317 (+) Transcript_35404:61-1011(+)|eukprot:CAMPEP_0202863372 /NCGR_PEP_ID=MMETSP1391-20130828/4034_1 /ASSEMBLY_ACC=CAM_ASM_000867 /TAXON_ID=1034604 /ORGANISM="Chlamydomonas leiostraca, Strain SAG 11-49" /LENGTH=316 /DNA_ID=CAMNT_0049543001 /DNA_START=12 /DNA_END=962 /DNA_ORIENTATION=-